ncbi:MAG TPA: anthranilate synthase component I family protein [Candidatus Nanopelagicales bacterium]|nr:anthranilate synthase component I family protein [Candidatus Nanopelagicales bacterium]
MPDLPALAHLGGQLATGLRDVTTDLSAASSGGWWAVVMTYEGGTLCARFDQVRPAPGPGGSWAGPAPGRWRSSLDRSGYLRAVATVREHIAAGTVYQVNVCRVLRAAMPDPGRADIAGLAALLARHNPAPYGGFVRLPAGAHPALPDAVAVASASPELFLRRVGPVVHSAPIKGTGRTAGDLTDKDRAENVMIVDLVRNDLGMVCRPGSVSVPDLLVVEPHPGLVQLVSTVRGELQTDTDWPELVAATFPPGSVTGAPKSTAMQVIRQLEPGGRGPYCGAVGWLEGDRGELAVGIRTFWLEGDELCFGTGAGITWGSDAEREWAETELKAHRLLRAAAGTWQAERP